MTVYYLAGPMTGLEQWNFPAFFNAATCLRAIGHDVLSPAEHDVDGGFDPASDGTGFDLCAAMRWDINAILSAEAVAVLPGWERSTGCAVELAVAKAIGIPIVDAATLIPIEAQS